jgi:DNA-binding Xre family transcriptional regulator
MIRFRIQELLAEKQFKEGRRVTLKELADATGISRVTLSKMVNQRGYGTLTDHLDRLCAYFNCKVSDLAEYVPNSDVEAAKD